MKMTTVGVRLSWDDKEKLDELCRERGVTTSELLREFIRGEVKKNKIFEELNSLKEILLPLASINIEKLAYHIARASVAPVAAVQMKDAEEGKRLNESVKDLAEKLTEKILSNGGNENE